MYAHKKKTLLKSPLKASIFMDIPQAHQVLMSLVIGKIELFLLDFLFVSKRIYIFATV
jgi:hypothetical protein